MDQAPESIVRGTQEIILHHQCTASETGNMEFLLWHFHLIDVRMLSKFSRHSRFLQPNKLRKTEAAIQSEVYLLAVTIK
jgi:hypothetical protein